MPGGKGGEGTGGGSNGLSDLAVVTKTETVWGDGCRRNSAHKISTAVDD